MFRTLHVSLVLLVSFFSTFASVEAQNAESFQIRLRSRTVVDQPEHPGFANATTETWNYKETAVVVCDMWDRHHSFNATQRVGELAPRIDKFLKHFRAQGATIVHAPSSCIGAYDDHPARKRTLVVPAAGKYPENINDWCDWISDQEKAAYPIDQSDGGVDDDPEDAKRWYATLEKEGRNPKAPWQRQIDTIEIANEDYISESGSEHWNIQEHLGIKNVLLVGVHTNMCVLGRPFGMRRLSLAGRNVALVRDLTDTMYNPSSAPFVNHFSGTDLIIQHTEKFVCPTVVSSQLVSSSNAFRFKADQRKHIVIVQAEKEYETFKTLPRFAKNFLARDFWVSYVFADPTNPNSLNNWEAIKDADLLVLSMRRRAIPSVQLEAIRKHVDAGKPLVAIRTSSHAFSLRDNQKPPENGVQWPEFDRDVLGGNYQGHHGNKDGKVRSFVQVNTSVSHPTVKFLSRDKLQTSSWLYKSSPLSDKAQPLITGTVESSDKPEPVAWTNQAPSGSRVFYTSLGHPDDFESTFFQQLLLNAVHWALEREPAKIGELENETSQVDEPTGLRQTAVAPLKVSSDLELDLVLENPSIANPLYINFDERGRMWVVEYRQYPWPAGLKLLSRDNVWRNVYEPAFPPPPPHSSDSPFRGKDRISVHWDSNGDGSYDQSKVFLDGLNLATAALKGRGGVFVLTPPYLLFYADKDDDCVPDSTSPEILLSGFGIEDSHAIANSLRWGPDGWIYATQGSTVSAAVVVHNEDGSKSTPVHSMGQNIWRYHPDKREYEIFAEGGGNAFGVEFDSMGNVFSGHNGGNTRGFHYVQGGYYLKNFGKHGSLSNPFAFDFFPAMKSENTTSRFTHTFEIYEAGTLPKRFHNRMVSISPNLHQVKLSDIKPLGSTFETQDIQDVVVSGDGDKADWFTPVDVQTGPDGSIYIADWFSVQSNHYKNHQGETNPDLGRIYRLRGTRFESQMPVDLSQIDSAALIKKYLGHSNRWYRETAVRLLAEGKDPASEKLLRDAIDQGGLDALPAFWALAQVSPGSAKEFLGHKNQSIRRWAIRIAEDFSTFDDNVHVVESVLKDSTSQVRSQVASTARRSLNRGGFDVAVALLALFDDSEDPHISQLIWWAIQNASPRDVIEMWKRNRNLWERSHRVGGMTMAECFAKQWASQPGTSRLDNCSQLLSIAPSEHRASISKQIVEGIANRKTVSIPEDLATRLADGNPVFGKLNGIRNGNTKAMSESLELIKEAVDEDRAFTGDEQLLLAAIANSKPDGLLGFLVKANNSELQTSLLAAIAQSKSAATADRLLENLGRWESPTRQLAFSILSSRKEWAAMLADAIDEQVVEKDELGQDVIDRLRLYDDSRIADVIKRHFPEPNQLDAKQVFDQTQAMVEVVRNVQGDAIRGRELYHSEKLMCGKCHRMFEQGGDIGPELTVFDRSNTESILRSVLFPSLEIREGYEPLIVLSEDGRMISGFKVNGPAGFLSIRESTGQTIQILDDEVEEIKAGQKSVMPDNLLVGLSEQEVADLFAFLSSTTPPK